ncbi:hypothetical protein [Streptomyces sp. KMM 9044]|uniref:hypothetical protein n=1 Tax=Streptomyces sp. KMM 9044 TaxID=2744474 RepID=UPI0021514ABE|nr:hypothetical protein [Streptomyces sp. KMM 9044]WAX76947.1 hypothetical protein HUV60_004030 [Streptomyces sp. KMM 9044]
MSRRPFSSLWAYSSPRALSLCAVSPGTDFVSSLDFVRPEPFPPPCSAVWKERWALGSSC